MVYGRYGRYGTIWYHILMVDTLTSKSFFIRSREVYNNTIDNSVKHSTQKDFADLFLMFLLLLLRTLYAQKELYNIFAMRYNF